MSAVFLLLAALSILGIGYVFYGRVIASLFGMAPHRLTPAKEKYDGVDYVPAPNWMVLFGHHFSSIAGAGPIIGPVIGCIYWGWLPSLLWVVLGTILIGGVHDFVVLMMSVREGGRSIAEIATDCVSKKARIIFSIFIWFALILVVAVFADLCAKTFVTEAKTVIPSLGLIPVAVLVGFLLYVKKADLILVTFLGLALLVGLLFFGEAFPVMIGPHAGTIWMVVLLAYSFIASVLPVNILLQPRDYLCGYLLIFGTMAGIIGLLITRPVLVQPAFLGWRSAEQGMLWPMMCVAIACGAISGFHALIASGTTSKQLATESHAQRIGYGAMVVEALVAVLAILAVTSGISKTGRELCVLLADAGPICVYGTGYAGLTKPILGPYGMFVAILVLNAFILTTLDTATRVCRYITQELFGISNRFISTLIVVVLAGTLALSGAWSRIWPIFGASNQLVAALSLFVAACWFAARRQATLYTLVPALFMFVTTMVALVLQAVSYWNQGNYLLVSLAVVLIVLSAVMVQEAGRSFKKSRG